MPTLQLAIDARAAKKGADEWTRQTDRVQESAKSTGLALTGMFAAIGSGFALRAAFNQVAGFEQRLAEIQGVTGATAEEFNSLEQAARKLGVASQYSATQAADAMLNLSKAGFTVTESISSVDEVLSLAQAHSLDLGRSSEIVIAAMRQFGISTEEATRVVDSFSATANLSSADVEDLAKSLEFAGPFANALGLELEQVNAVLGVLSNSMIRGAKGGTAVRAILEGLANPSIIARKAFEELKVSVDDMNPQLHSMTEIFELLGQRNMTAIQAVKIFGVEAASAALTLKKNASQIDEYIGKQKDMIGSTRELAAIMSATPLGALGRLLAAIREITISLGRDTGLTGMFVTAANFLRDVLIVEFTNFGDTITSSRDTVMGFIRVMEAFAAATITRVAVPALALLVTQIKNVTLAIRTLTIAIATNPIGLLLTAIAAGVGTLVYFRDTIIDLGDKSFSIMDLMTAGWEHFVEILRFAGKTFGDLWNNNILPILEGMRRGFLVVFEAIGSQADNLLSFFGTNWRTAITEVANFSIASFMTMHDAFTMVFETITRGVKAIANIDWTNSTSIALGAASLISAFDPVNVGKRLGDATAKNFSTDWVKGIRLAASDGWENFSSTWNAFAQTDVGSRVNALFNPAEMFKSITERANSLRLEREAALNAIPAEAALGKTIAQTTEEVLLATGALQGMTKEQQEASDTLRQMVSDLAFERSLIGLTAAEVEKLNTLRDAEQIIRDAQLENGAEYIAQLQQEINLLQQARGNKWYEDYLKNVRSDITLVNMSNDARQIAIAMRDAEAYGLENNVQAMNKYLAVLQRELEMLQKMQQIKQLADNVGDAFSYALGDIVVNAKNANEALNDLLLTVYKLVFNEVVGKPIAAAISSGLFGIFGGLFTAGVGAKGLAYDSGGVVPMAAGGIVRSPTRVPMAKGSALMGEQGAEAVFPLTKMSDGRLGLSADVGNRGNPTVVNINITAKDVDSFRRSQPQIAAAMQRAASRSMSAS